MPPIFKSKANKQKPYPVRVSTTLDLKHREMLNEFEKNKNKITTLKYELNALKLELSMLMENVGGSITDNIERKLELEDKIKDIKTTIKNLKNQQKSYYLDNSKYIFDYFEHKKNISENDNEKNPDPNSPSVSISSKTTLVENFFKIKKDKENTSKSITDPSANNDDIYFSLSHQPKPINQPENIVQKYLSNLSDDYFDINQFVYQTDVCQICHRGELISIEEEGILLCSFCCRSIPHIVEIDKPSYKEPPKEICSTAYKRINHLKEILAQCQGKETTQIPKEVIENIQNQMKKERITLNEMTNAKTKEILKKLGYNKYYEHIPFIKEKLGIKPPVMSPELEETLCNLFIEIQAPYSKYCPDDRMNFLNYYYTVYKLCELLGETKYLKHFPMLKDPEKIMEQDIIWKKICEELDWEFIPTVYFETRN